MKTRKPVFSFAFGLLLSVSAQAKDYYVSINGTGNGSSASQPANITALRNYLATYNVRTDYPNSRQLNVYFGGGTYTVSSGGWKFSAAAANVSGLHVRFAPVSGNAVTFQGARQNCKFLEMPAGVKADSSLSVTMENVTVRNFKSIAAGISGESSLFVVGQYNKLNLNTVTITDISSNRMPLFWIGAGAEVNVNHSVINNISSSTSSFETAKNASTLNIRHTSMSGWSMGRFMFELYNQQATLTMDSCSIQNNSMAFLFNNYATGRVELKNLVFSNNKTANYPYIDMRGGNMNVSRCTFEKNGITSGNNDFFHLEGTKYQIDHCVFNNNTAGDDFFELAANATVDQCKFTGNTTRGKHFFLLKTATVVTDCIFDGNTLTASDIDNALIYQLTPGVDKPFVMSGSTFSGNEITRAITRCYLFTTHAGMSAQDFCTLIINNTFSNHPDVTEAISIRTSENTFRGGVVNNTFYRSRGVRLGNDNSTPTRHVIANNLLIEGSIVSATGKPDYFVRNIFNNTYYATGLGGGVALGNLSAFVAPALIPYAAGKPGVHALVLTSGNNPILGKGGNRADPLNQEWIQYLRLDQRKKQRPPNLSAGAWDLTALEITDGDYTVFYDSDTGILPEYTIDLSRYIVMYPDSADRDHLLFHILSQPQNGTVRIDTANRYLLHFAPHTEQGNPGKPAAGMIGLKAQMSYHAEYTGGGVAYSQNPGLSITIRDIRQHPGITDETQVRCYTGMGQTDFVAEDKFISGNVNPANHRYDGFTSPLAGDLNGDGKPEIVVMGLENSTGASLYGTATCICILNGQTGQETVRYPLPAQWQVRDPSHNTPSWMALVDADRNGKAEIIVACGYTEWGETAKYRKQLVSYEVNDKTFLPATPSLGTEHPDRLTQKWTSSVRYDQSTSGVADTRFAKASPLPQVVDVNGDGVAEILVYNKLYHAVTGELLITLEDLEPNSTWNTRNRTVAQYRQYAYVGRGRHTSWYDNGVPADRNINFSFVYDLDEDGKMEIIAGGKVYYRLDPAKGSYSVKSADDTRFGGGQGLGIGDGYTGVADVNADGKAEIVVASNTSDEKNLRIRVWDPAFITVDPQGNKIPVADIAASPPALLADITVPFTYSARQGTHSYVYIGDIDGKIDPVSKKKYPEISVLGPRLYDNRIIPNHPNVPSFGGNYVYTSGDGDHTARGALMSWTWNNDPAATVDNRLKVSFLLEHNDRSLNTGFTMFDFDNDGVQEICYRDEKNLRIISAGKHLVRLNDSDSRVIRFKKDVKSYTGYEYPVIADIDGDGSADIIVMGSPNDLDARGYIYVVQAKPGKTTFAPAPKMWNQFMYSPLKIQEDLAVPMINLHPLSPALGYVLQADVNSKAVTQIYNNTITQVVKSAIFPMPDTAGNTVNVLQPIVVIPDAKISGARVNRTTTPPQLEFYVVNTGNGTLNGHTPVTIFKGDDSYVPSGFFAKITVGADLFPNDSTHIIFPFPAADLDKSFTIRVSDSTCNNRDDLFMQHYQECNWADNTAETGIFLLRNDAATVVFSQTAIIDVLANDSLGTGCSVQLREADLVTPGGAGVMTGSFGAFEITGNRLKYTPPPPPYRDSILVEAAYTVHCYGVSKRAKVYIYIVESCTGNFSVCAGVPYRFCLYRHDPGIRFDWRDSQGVYLGSTEPFIPSPVKNALFYVKPYMPAGSRYERIDFPFAKIETNIVPFIRTGPVYRLPNR